ncbi:MAG: aminotransferase class I/II-fold pyridoxal phosphate-dependent enzyme [bacterium]|nr:aminotransferase class I/II-fold pyridoxal phosphate-dependent enzyme [bacterium]
MIQDFFNNYVQSIETYIMFRIKEKVAKITPVLVEKGRPPISLSMGAPTQAPPQEAIELLQKHLTDAGINTYSTPKGEKLFREACARRMKERFGVDLDAENEIYSLIGSKEGLANFIRAIINPIEDESKKDIIMIPDPGYASYKEMIKVSGGLAYPVPLTSENNYMPDMEYIFHQLISDGYDEKRVKALLINYPHNPLGVTANLEYFKSIVDFCKKHNILLMSDAAYTDMYFKEDLKPASILQIEGAKDIAVEFFSFSKPYAMTGWRLGWICGNRDAIRIFGKLKSTIDSGIFKALQKTCAEILNSEKSEVYIKQSNATFKRNQELFVNGLKELGWKNFNIPDATFYLWLPIPPRYEKSIDFANDIMEKSGIIVAPGEAFGKYGEGFFRVSLVCSENDLVEVIRRMKEDGFYFN